MSKLSQIDDCFFDIKKSLITEKMQNDFLTYLNKYYETCENTTKLSEIDVLNKFDRVHSIYYNKTSQLYYHYINGDFISLNEDNLLYLVLEFISNNVLPIDTKQKIILRNKIIKQIKDNNIYETIPDSKTIQTILSLLNETLFLKKAYSKCFLITVGRIILQKKVDNDFLIFTRANMKSFLSELNKNISIYFCNTNVFNFFKFKFTQDHSQSNIKKYVLPCTKINSNNIRIAEQEYINMIIVAIYYYNRYNTIDNYLESENILFHVKESITYLYTDKVKIVKQFVDEHIIKEEKQSIQQKQLIFLWKKFTYEKDIFVNSFTSYNDFILELFDYLKTDCDKNNNNNILCGYYSLDLPYVDDFKSFWNTNFSFCEDETNFEINEILFLYNKFSKIKKNNLNEALIKLIIQCFYPMYELVGNKMINGIKCSLWDKKTELDHFIESQNINVEDNLNLIYKKYVSTTKNEYRISKDYLQHYIKKLITKS